MSRACPSPPWSWTVMARSWTTSPALGPSLAPCRPIAVFLTSIGRLPRPVPPPDQRVSSGRRYPQRRPGLSSGGLTGDSGGAARQLHRSRWGLPTRGISPKVAGRAPHPLGLPGGPVAAACRTTFASRSRTNELTAASRSRSAARSGPLADSVPPSRPKSTRSARRRCRRR